MTYTVGLTGGIGSGKSTVSRLFAQLQVPIIDADTIARELVAKDTPAYNAILDHFGRTILNEQGELNRSKLREVIFSSDKHRNWLESLLHPAIREKILSDISQITFPYCIVVIPLLAENYKDYQHILNEVLIVDVDETQQISWAMKRDHADEAEITRIMQSQADRKARQAIATIIIENNSSLVQLNNRVKKLHQQLLTKANSYSQ